MSGGEDVRGHGFDLGGGALKWHLGGMREGGASRFVRCRWNSGSRALGMHRSRWMNVQNARPPADGNGSELCG